jgi:GWxTD domain-containing protein
MADHPHRTLLLAFLLTLLVLPVATARPQNNPVQSLSKPYQKWLDEDVPYIITDQERADFGKFATDAKRDKFVEDFWERRNPSPGSEENTFKADYYQRISYANERFASNIRGWKTDHVRIFIAYGPPMSVSNIRAAPRLVR